MGEICERSSVRLSYADSNKNGVIDPSTEIIEENNYYPFGLKHEGYNSLAGNQAYKYKYNGKELQETGMYDYGARMYMPDIGRWGVVDELAENFNKYSPYNYVKNTPINGFDPDGRDVIILNDSNAVAGLGHAAVIVGNEKDGWFYYSMNGTTDGDSEKGNAIGESKVPNLGTPLGVGISPQQAMLKANKINPNKTHNYDRFVVIKTTKEEDEMIKEKAKNAANKDTYKVIGQSCQNVVLDSYNELLNIRANGVHIMENMPIPNAFFNSIREVVFLDNLLFIPKKNEIEIKKTPVLTVELIPEEKFE